MSIVQALSGNLTQVVVDTNRVEETVQTWNLKSVMFFQLLFNDLLGGQVNSLYSFYVLVSAAVQRS